MDDMIFDRHYIRTGLDGRIIKGFSDAFEQPEDGDICINQQGGYQFRLFPEGEENPRLRDENGVPLYKWNGKKVLPRTKTEIEADTPEPEPVVDIMGDIIAALVDLEYRMILTEMGA